MRKPRSQPNPTMKIYLRIGGGFENLEEHHGIKLSEAHRLKLASIIDCYKHRRCGWNDPTYWSARVTAARKIDKLAKKMKKIVKEKIYTYNGTPFDPLDDDIYLDCIKEIEENAADDIRRWRRRGTRPHMQTRALLIELSQVYNDAGGNSFALTNDYLTDKRLSLFIDFVLDLAQLAQVEVKEHQALASQWQEVGKEEKKLISRAGLPLPQPIPRKTRAP